jgi:hypothetical protein
VRRRRRSPEVAGHPPRVYVGPNAERALGGERGVLLGSRRAAWVDVLEFDPRPDVGIQRLVDLRFSAAGSWDVVGLSLSSSDLRRRLVPLLRELVPGDVVLTEKGPRFHSGAAWVEATLQRDFRRAT